MAPKKRDVAEKIVACSLREVVCRAPFLSPALSALKLQEGSPKGGRLFATDGIRLVFDRDRVIAWTREHGRLPSRQVAHLIAHCLLLCPFKAREADKWAFSLASDVVAERIADDLLGAKNNGRIEAQTIVRDQMAMDIGEPLSLKRLTEAFEEGRWENMLDSWATYFQSDDHSLWYPRSLEKRDGEQGDGQDQTRLPSPGEGQGQEHLPDSGVPSKEEMKAARKRWEKALERVAAELKGKDISGAAGSELLEAAESLQGRMDLTEFLRRFCRMHERPRPSDADFDVIFYTYGLDLFGDMPLIEAAELKETRDLHSFVVALDTSASIDTEALARFVEVAFDVLKASGAIGRGGSVHIMCADAKVQSDEVIASEGDLVRWKGNTSLIGGGGTDFRCVFERIEQLRSAKALRAVDGLVYLTDGDGIYPKVAPDYPVAFVLTPESGQTRKVPPWALRLEMSESDLGVRARRTLWD
jgi:hypothetical protein